MPLLDERGRLFGRVNLIDAAVMLFALVLVPLTYAAYLLFRTPTPVITSVQPLAVGVSKDVDIEIKGSNLRPFLRGFLGATQVDYLFSTPDRAVLTLPELPVGEYELALYDEAKVVAKGPRISVNEPPDFSASVLAIGTFNHLHASEASAIKIGMKLPAVGSASQSPAPVDVVEILGTRTPSAPHVPIEPSAASIQHHPLPPSAASIAEGGERQQLVALVRLQGRLVGSSLVVGRTTISPSVEVRLPLEVGAAPASSPTDTAAAGAAGSARQVTFTIERLYPARATSVDVRLRIITRPEVLKVAQRDVAQVQHDPFESLFPQLLSARVTDELDGREGRQTIVDAIVRFPAVSTVDGWFYDNNLLRPGEEIAIETPRWRMNGTVLSIEPRNNDG